MGDTMFLEVSKKVMRFVAIVIFMVVAFFVGFSTGFVVGFYADASFFIDMPVIEQEIEEDTTSL